MSPSWVWQNCLSFRHFFIQREYFSVQTYLSPPYKSIKTIPLKGKTWYVIASNQFKKGFGLLLVDKIMLFEKKKSIPWERDEESEGLEQRCTQAKQDLEICF